LVFFSVWLAYFIPSAQIYSYEPLPSNFSFLEKNAQKNFPERIHPSQFGIASSKRIETLYESPTNTGGHSLLSHEGHPLTISCVSLLDVLRQNKLSHIDLLKLDCEGAEYDILLKSPPSLFKRIHAIVLEEHPYLLSSPVDLVSFLERKGYRVTRSPHLMFARRPALVR